METNYYNNNQNLDDSFLNFGEDLKKALECMRPNNGLLDKFSWNKHCLFPFLPEDTITDTFKNIEMLWIDSIMEYEYYKSREIMLEREPILDSIMDMSAFDILIQRFTFLCREHGHHSRNSLTKKEIKILKFQFDEFESHFLITNQFCKCEKRSMINWLVRVINIILQKNIINDTDFQSINKTFEYYKTVNISEVIYILNAIDNNHNFQKKYFCD
jgi:hypothetical protein